MSFYGASDEARTRYLHLGKVALYQMSYTRDNKRDDTRYHPFCQQVSQSFLKIMYPCLFSHSDSMVRGQGFYPSVLSRHAG